MAGPQNEDSNQTTETSDIQLTVSEAIIVSNESTALPETSQNNTVTSGGSELGQDCSPIGGQSDPVEDGQICQGSAKVEDLSEIAKDLLEVSETLKSYVETTNDSTTTDNSKSDSKDQEQGSNDTPNCDDTSQNTD